MSTSSIESSLKQHFDQSTPSFTEDADAFVSSVMSSLETSPAVSLTQSKSLFADAPSVRDLIQRNLVLIMSALIGLIILLSQIDALAWQQWLAALPFSSQVSQTGLTQLLMNESFMLLMTATLYCTGVFFWLIDYNEPLT